MRLQYRMRSYMRYQKGGRGSGICFSPRINLSVLENWTLSALHCHSRSNLQPSNINELLSHNPMLISASHPA